MILNIASKNLQVMAANRYHAGLVVLVLLLFCTFGRCTNLRFERTGSRDNNITLRCADDLGIPIPNANFFVMRAPGSSRQSLQDLDRDGVIMFTLTPETEGYFFCQNPNPPNDISERLLLAGEKE